MKAYFDVEQNSLDWHLLRHGRIGGTSSSGLFVKSDTLFYELLAEKTERYNEEQEERWLSDDMQRGKDLEPEAREVLKKRIGVDLLECGWIQSDIDLLGISPDGISNCLTIQCEIKCPGAKKHLRTCLEDVIPLDNINQCIHAFAVNPMLEVLYFMSYRPESIKPIFIKELRRNDEINIGTKAKPILKSVAECVKIIHDEANKLQQQLTETINKLNF